jgi:hypothetical protein
MREKSPHYIVQQVDNVLLIIDRTGRFPLLSKYNIDPVDTTENKEKHKTKKCVFNPCPHTR